MNCSSCNCNIPDDARFCPHCGTEVVIASASPTSKALSGRQVLTGLVFGTLGIAGAAYFMDGDRSSRLAPSSESAVANSGPVRSSEIKAAASEPPSIRIGRGAPACLQYVDMMAAMAVMPSGNEMVIDQVLSQHRCSLLPEETLMDPRETLLKRLPNGVTLIITRNSERVYVPSRYVSVPRSPDEVASDIAAMERDALRAADRQEAEEVRETASVSTPLSPSSPASDISARAVTGSAPTAPLPAAPTVVELARTPEPIPPTPAVALRGSSPDDYYPETSRRLGEQGTCVVAASVGIDGKTANPAITESSNVERLDEACLKYVKSVRMKPATENGQPVPSTTSFTVRFRLPGQS